MKNTCNVSQSAVRLFVQRIIFHDDFQTQTLARIPTVGPAVVVARVPVQLPPEKRAVSLGKNQPQRSYRCLVLATFLINLACCNLLDAGV